MADYVMADDDNPTEVAQQLIAAAGADNVHWYPRPDTPGGGVFAVNDEQAVADVVRKRQQARTEEAERIAASQKAADERDRKADETGLTPAQLGFAANTGTDPGSADAAKDAIEAAQRRTAAQSDATGTTPAEQQGDDADVQDEPDDEDADEAAEKPMTPAEKRAARRKANAETKTTDEGNTAPEDGK